MEKTKIAMLGLLGASLAFAGCQTQGVKKTCSTEIYGSKIKITYGAKSEDSPIDSAALSASIPLSFLEMAGIDTSDKKAVEEYVLEEIGSDSSPESDFNVKVGSDHVDISGKATQDELEELTGSSSSAQTFKELSDSIEKTGIFTCE